MYSEVKTKVFYTRLPMALLRLLWLITSYTTLGINYTVGNKPKTIRLLQGWKISCTHAILGTRECFYAPRKPFMCP